MRVVIPTAAAVALLSAIYAAQAEDSAAKADGAQQNEALRERPDNFSGEKMREPGTNDMGRENDGTITRSRTREDVVREIFSGQRGNESARKHSDEIGRLRNSTYPSGPKD